MNQARPFTSVKPHNVSEVIPHAVVLDLKHRIACHGASAVRESIAHTIHAEQGIDGGSDATWRAESIVRRVQSLTIFPDGAGLLLAVPFLVVANSGPSDGYGYPYIPGRLPLSCHRGLVALLAAAPHRNGVVMRARRVAVAPQAVWQRLQQGSVGAPGLRSRKPVDCDNFMHTGGRGGGSTVAVRLVLVEARLRGTLATERLQQLFGAGGPSAGVNWQGLLDWGRREFQGLGLCDLLPVYGPAGDVLGEVAAYLNIVTLDLLADAAGLTCKQVPRLARAQSCEQDWSRGAARTRSGSREEVRVAAYADGKERAEARLCVGSGLTAADIDRALAAHAARYQPIASNPPVAARRLHNHDAACRSGWLADGA